jgi:deoxyribodipyrimidine photolyase
MSSAILWLRNDLRILDQPLLTAALSKKSVWIYVFDLRFLSNTVPVPGELSCVQKSSARRALFILQSVRDMSERLRRHLQADLLVRVGHPEEEICKCAEKLAWNSWDVHCQFEIGTEEQRIQDAVAASAAANGGQLHASWGHQFLYHPNDVQASTGSNPMEVLVNPHHFWSDDADPENMVRIREPMDFALPENSTAFQSNLSQDVIDPAGLLSMSQTDALKHLGYTAEDAVVACTPDPRSVLFSWWRDRSVVPP